jgi:cytochrome c oxidase subunit 2
VVEGGQRRVRGVIIGATTGSVVLLVFLILASVGTDRALAQLPLQDAVHVEVTGHQWWWGVRYDDADPSRIFETANEIRVPVGRPVLLTLRSSDVIHSFWIPSLHGKKDLIPGRTATLALQADRAGTYGGQCAEFCGAQHALMGLVVIAMPPAEYETWAAHQRETAPEPADESAKRGKAVFMRGTCPMCHAIQGTEAGARTGPDLTHIAGRVALASGAFENNAANLAAWIRDPQKMKPGVRMPANPLAEEDLAALVAYLGSLT